MKRLIFLFVSVFFVLSTVIVVSYAWFVNTEFNRPTVSGYSAAAYFAAGDGSEEDPYQIATPRHLYNLAWLQYLGQFNKKVDGELEKQYHFEIVQDIDMDGLALPPIGTEENPFVGTLDGNSNTITNLVTTNNMTNLKAHPSGITQIENASIIGFFGIIGNYNEAFSGIASSTVMSASNFYLDNFEVETITENTLIGMAAGYIASNGTIRNIGIHYSWFNMNPTTSISKLSAFDNISNYALVGDYDGDSIEWADKPGSGGPGYGTSTDIEQLYKDLGGKDGATIGKAEAYPFRPSDPTIIPASSSTKEMELQSGRKKLSVAQTQASSESNIGYYVGSDVKVYHKTGVDYSKFYYPDTSSYSRELTGDELPDQSIIDYLNIEGDYEIRLSGSSQLDVQNEGGQVVVENGQVGTYKGDILLPTRCIWVAPIRSGTLKFVFVNIESSPMGMCIEKLTRSKPGDYSSYFLSSVRILSFNALLLPGKAYYFEVDVTQEDIDSGYEYAVTGGDEYKPWFSYIDIGAAGGGAVPEYTGQIEGVDFVYRTGSGYSDFTDKSDVIFVVSGETGSPVILYFRRNATDGVLYFVDPSSTTITLTPSGSGASGEARNKNCES